MFRPLDNGDGGDKRAGVAPLLVAAEGAVGVSGVKEEWTRVSLREWSLWKVEKGGEGNMSGGGILLEVTEIASDGLLDVDADAARSAELFQQLLFLFLIYS
eukprot:g31853.t1